MTSIYIDLGSTKKSQKVDPDLSFSLHESDMEMSQDSMKDKLKKGGKDNKTNKDEPKVRKEVGKQDKQKKVREAEGINRKNEKPPSENYEEDFDEIGDEMKEASHHDKESRKSEEVIDEQHQKSEQYEEDFENEHQKENSTKREEQSQKDASEQYHEDFDDNGKSEHASQRSRNSVKDLKDDDKSSSKGEKDSKAQRRPSEKPNAPTQKKSIPDSKPQQAQRNRKEGKSEKSAPRPISAKQNEGRPQSSTQPDKRPATAQLSQSQEKSKHAATSKSPERKKSPKEKLFEPTITIPDYNKLNEKREEKKKKEKEEDREQIMKRFKRDLERDKKALEEKKIKSTEFEEELRNRALKEKEEYDKMLKQKVEEERRAREEKMKSRKEGQKTIEYPKVVVKPKEKQKTADELREEILNDPEKMEKLKKSSKNAAFRIKRLEDKKTQREQEKSQTVGGGSAFNVLIELEEVEGGTQALPEHMVAKQKYPEDEQDHLDKTVAKSTQNIEDQNLNKATSLRKTQKKEDPDAILKKLFNEYKQKEQKNQEIDDKIYASENLDKKVKTGHPQLQQNNDRAKLEKGWAGNGLGVRAQSAKVESKDSMLTGSSQQLAQHMLKKLELNLQKTGKLGEPKASKEVEPIKEVEPKKMTKEEKEKAAKEQSWSLQVGAGISTEYLKAQKDREQAARKKYTEFFKDEQQRKLNQQKEKAQLEKQLMKKEREEWKTREKELMGNKFASKKEAAQIKTNELKEQKQLSKELLDTEGKEAREKLQTEIILARKKLKVVSQQNAELKRKDNEFRKNLESLEEEINKYKNQKGLIALDKGQYTTMGFVPDLKNYDFKVSSSETGSNNNEDQFGNSFSSAGRDINQNELSLIELIVIKIADQGMSLENVYQKLDQNEDGVLTIKEVSDNISKIGLVLDQREVKEILRVLDVNTDGLITKEEFTKALAESLETRKEYKAIMGELDDIYNPIVLEERILDMQARKKLIQQDIERVAKGMSQDESAYRKLVEKLKKYEKMAGTIKRTKEEQSTLKASLSKTRAELQDIEDQRSKLLMMHEERMSSINENISSLDTDILRTQELIKAEKKKLREKTDEAQKMRLKQLFINKAMAQMKRKDDDYEFELQKQALELAEAKARGQIRDQEAATRANLNFVVLNSSATKIQRVFRGRQERKAQQSKFSLMIRMKNRVIKAWKDYKRRKRARKVFDAYERPILRLLRIGLNSIKEQFFSHLESERREREERERLEREKEEEEERLRMIEEQRNIEEENKRLQEEEEKKEQAAQLENVKGSTPDYLHHLYSVIRIQMIYRSITGRRYAHGHGVWLENVPNIQRHCQACKKNYINKICKECHLSLFCNKCFAEYHKFGLKKNHVFLPYRDEEEHAGQKLKSGLEAINEIKRDYSTQFANLQSQFVARDLKKIGILPFEKIKSVLQGLVKNARDLEILLDYAKDAHQVKEQDYFNILNSLKIKPSDVEKSEAYIDYTTFAPKLQS